MPRKFQLYWDKHLKYWFKKFDGKKVYFGRGTSKYLDNASYQEALVKYEEYLDKQRLNIEKDQKLKNYYVDRKNQRPENTIGGALDRYYEHHKERQTGGHITAHRLNMIRSSLRTFEKFLGRGPNTKMYEQDGLKNHFQGKNAMDRMRGYYKHLKTKVERSEYVVMTAHCHWCIAKDFVKFIYERAYINSMPRGLHRHKFYTKNKSFGVGQIKVFSVKQIQDLFLYAHHNLQYPVDLWISLGLNCGFTAIDIGTLKYEHIRWGADGKTPERIIKIRTKTQQYGEWKLWDCTKRLLMQWFEESKSKTNIRIQSPDHLFFGRKGQMVYSTTQKDNKNSKLTMLGGDTGHVNDAIGKAFTRMIKDHFPDMLGLGFKTLRKSGVTGIQRLQLNNTLLIEQLYLAHKPKTVARQYYTAIDADTLDTALEKLEYKFALGDFIETKAQRIKRKTLHRKNSHERARLKRQDKLRRLIDAKEN